MGLNIKNEEAHKLASELAEVAGETMTKAVTVALRERLDRLRKRRNRASLAELMEISRQSAQRIRQPANSLDHGDLLYDERGLPK